MNSKKVPESSNKYICLCCDYNTSRSSQYNRHLSTGKHIRIQKESQKGSESSIPIIKCNCGKIYKYVQGLYKHKKKCSQQPLENTMITPALIIDIVKQNQSMQTMLIEQQKENKELVNKVIQLSREPTVINNNNNSGNITQNNKQFNLQFFLNDTCKDAITIKQFIDNIQVTLQDLENVGKNGYVKGIIKQFTYTRHY